MSLLVQTFGGATGDVPPWWTAQLIGTGANFTVQAPNALRLASGTGFNGGTAVLGIGRHPDGRGRVLVEALFSDITQAQFFLTIQVGADSGARSPEGYQPGGYSAKFEPQLGTIELVRHNPFTVIGTASGITYSAGVNICELMVVDGLVHARTYPRDSGVVGWQAVIADATPTPTPDSQWVSLGWKSSTGVAQTIDITRLEFDDLHGEPR